MEREQKLFETFFKRTLDGVHLLPGMLREGRRVCGKKRCRCARGQLHPRRVEYGYYEGGKFHMKKIPPEYLQEASKAVRRMKLLEEALASKVRDSQRTLLPYLFSPKRVRLD